MIKQKNNILEIIIIFSNSFEKQSIYKNQHTKCLFSPRNFWNIIVFREAIQMAVIHFDMFFV